MIYVIQLMAKDYKNWYDNQQIDIKKNTIVAYVCFF